MKRSAKLWLVFALVLCAATTCLNTGYGRWPSVALALVSMAGLAILLFRQQKLGFWLLCGAYTLSFLVGVSSGLTGETGLAAAIVMSFIGSAFVPVVTALVLRSQWKDLR